MSSEKGSDLYGDFSPQPALEPLKNVDGFADMKERQEVVSQTDREESEEEDLYPAPC